MNIPINEHIDIHTHVGLVGDRWPEWGKMSTWYRDQLTFKTFLLYARIQEKDVCDKVLRETCVKVLSTTEVKRVVCLALDPVYDTQGHRREDASHVWVDNEYVLALQKEVGPENDPKVLLGASVHPFDPEFETRVSRYVDKGAVLIKWIPSSQQINLADYRVGERLKFLAHARGGKPLPLLLHIGPEYAIPTSDSGTVGYDCISWSGWDRFANWFRGSKRWYTPQVQEIEQNIRAGLDAGAIISFAHCGLPYFTSGILAKLFEHSEFDSIRSYLSMNETAPYPGRCYADVSALCTPFRRVYFPEVRDLPKEYLLYGSDFPTPVFELSAGPQEFMEDFEAVLNGDIDRIVIPEGNLLDVNYRELSRAFPGHPMFSNFAGLL